MSFAATTTASSLRSFARSRVVDRRSARAGSASRARARGALVVRASGVDPESLAILQQRLGQRIELEGQGAAQLNQTAGKLLGADGRAIDKDERKKVLKADEQAGQALEMQSARDLPALPSFHHLRPRSGAPGARRDLGAARRLPAGAARRHDLT